MPAQTLDQTNHNTWKLSLPGLTPSHLVFRALHTLQAMLILARLGLGSWSPAPAPALDKCPDCGDAEALPARKENIILLA